MNTVRNPLAVTAAVWQALFLREALARLFDARAAWFWLLIEPVLHIAFISFVLSVIRLRTIGNADVVVWACVGLLAFFFFRRTAVQVSWAVDSSRRLFTYRQVKPFDPAIARALLEAFLLSIISAIVLIGAGLLGYETIARDPLLVLQAVFGLWVLGLGYGLIASVLMALVPEMAHVLKIVMLPLYLASGVIFPLQRIPQPYLDWLLYNPIPHALEHARLGFFPYYQTLPGISLGYLYAWAVSLLFLGLVLFRVFDRRLVMQ